MGLSTNSPVDAAYANPGNRPLKGNIRNLQGRRGPDDGQNIGIVFLIHRKDRGNHLGFIKIIFRKQGPQRAVDQTGGEGFFFTGTADFSPEKAARNPAGRIGHLLVIYGEGKKIDPLPDVLGRDDGDQDDGFAVLDPYRAGGLFGHATGF